jgi:hypothetical protein
VLCESNNFSKIGSFNKINGTIRQNFWESTAGSSQLRLHKITAKPTHVWNRNLDFKNIERLEAQEMKFITTVLGLKKRLFME